MGILASIIAGLSIAAYVILGYVALKILSGILGDAAKDINLLIACLLFYPVVLLMLFYYWCRGKLLD